MKILLLSQWFQPEPAFKGLPLAQALRDRGHEVEVLTGFPNYPGGRVYPGYRIRVWQRETMDAITVNRVALYPSHDKSGLRRSLNYLSFGLSAATIGQLLPARADVIYALNLVTLGLSADLFKMRFRCPVVFDVQDLWPDSVVSSQMMNSPFLVDTLGRWCRHVYGSATHLIVLSPGMKGELARRGLDPAKISVVHNWCNERDMRPADRNGSLAGKYGLRDCFVVMFAGTMGVMQKLDILLDAAGRLARQEPSIRFAFVGGGVEAARLEKTASSERLSNVVFLGRQPAEEMAEIIGLADVMILHLKDSSVFRMAIPSKIQAYMAAGKPIIAAIRGDAEIIVNESGAGEVVAPEDPEAIAEAVLKFYRMPESTRRQMGLQGLEYYKAKMSMDAGVNAIESILADSIRTSRSQ